MAEKFLTKEILKYGEVNSYDVLKTIAFFTMIIDHLGYYFFYKFNFLRLIGRATIIIYAVLYGISYKKGKKPHKKILYFAILTSSFQFIIVGLSELLPLNVLWWFYFSNFFMDSLDNIYNENYALFVLFVLFMPILSISSNYFIEYGFGFIMLEFCGKIFSKEVKNKKDIISTVSIFIMFFIYQVYNFNFKIIHSVLLAIMYIILYKLLFNFKLKIIKQSIITEKFGNLFMIISRKSAELYAIHLILFMLILSIMIKFRIWLF